MAELLTEILNAARAGLIVEFSASDIAPLRIRVRDRTTTPALEMRAEAFVSAAELVGTGEISESAVTETLRMLVLNLSARKNPPPSRGLYYRPPA